MSRYVVRPTMAGPFVIPDWWSGMGVVGTADWVHEQDKSPIPTGLLSADGCPIYRVQETVPFGFQPPKKQVEK